MNTERSGAVPQASSPAFLKLTNASLSPGRPRVGITCGDPAGIGPEIALKAVRDPRTLAACQPVLIGAAAGLQRAAGELRLPWRCAPLHGTATQGTAIQETVDSSGEPFMYDIGEADESFSHGRPSAAGGRSAIKAIETAVRLALSGELDAIATAPISKTALRMAGSPFPGHTEMLASLTGAPEVLMCFFGGGLKVFLLTVHLSLADAIRSITRARVESAVRLANRELRRLGIASPKIAVSGLNPHAGEAGLFGQEEIQEISPAIAACREVDHIDVSGPWPADTVFVRAARGEFDAVAACTHDQGLIAVKCLAFGHAVNVTLGLPIIRTSVDHGTAFDIAGRGIADHSSMVESIVLAAEMAARLEGGLPGPSGKPGA